MAGRPTPLTSKLVELVPDGLQATYRNHPPFLLMLDLVIVMGAFLPLKRVMTVNTVLPESTYAEWSIAFGLLAHVNAALLVAAAILAVTLTRFGALLDPWRNLEWGNRLRVVVLLLGFVVAWPFATYGYNHFLDQGHYLDRILVVALLALTFFRPVFVLPFVAMVMAVMWQFVEPPLGGSIFAHKLQVLYPLILFGAAFVVHAATGRFPARAFAVLFCCMVAASYWEAARVKLSLGWVTDNELHLILSAAYNHGWLGTLSPGTITSAVAALAPLDVPLQVFVMALEVACLVPLANRRLTLLLLAGLIMFHAGVFAFYGFLFWTWVAVDAVLIWFLLRTRPDVFGMLGMALCVPLVALGAFWAHTPSLGWLDTRVGYTYHLDAVTVDNQRLALPADYFAPYQDAFTMMGFSYLADHAVLTGPYAVAHNADLAATLRVAPDRASLELIEAGATSAYDAERADKFRNFISHFVRNKYANGDRLAWLRHLSPPDQFWGARPSTSYDGRSEIREVTVTEVTTVFGERGPQVVRTLELARISISQSQSTDRSPE